MFSKLTISQRIWTLAVLSLAIFAITFLFQTFQAKSALLDAKRDKLVAVVDAAYSQVAAAHERFKQGELTEEQAQTEAKDALRRLRYQGQEYVWINDLDHVMLMHPIKPALDGKNLASLTDKKGKKLFVEVVKVVKADGDGFVDYYWAKPGADANESFAKLSRVMGFTPWGWVVGSGVYIDDVDEEFNAILTKNIITLVVIMLLMGALFYLIIRSVVRPLDKISNAMVDISQGEGDLTVRLKAKGRDELAVLAGGFNGFAEKVQGVVVNVRGYGDEVVTSAEQLTVVTDQSNRAMQTHQEETHQVAAAVTELSATIQEVAQNAADAAQAVQAVRQQALSGKQVVDGSVQSITELAGSVEQAAGSIRQLEGEVQNIGGILDVIRSIADQTNLLALNAAIEAARAGEQGRGFAVVADEVRSLAQRTQESTEEIQSMIEQLESEAQGAVKVILSGSELAESSVGRATEAGQTLNQITEDILTIADMNTQIASATEQQSATVDMISSNVNNINHAFEETAGSTEQINSASQRLRGLADQLHAELDQFRA